MERRSTSRPFPSERLRGLLALALVQIFFGLFPVAGKWAFLAFPPAAVAAWRILFGAAALLALAFARHGRGALPSRRETPRLLLCALTGVVLNQGLFLEGLSRTQALNTGLLMCIIPVATYGLAVLVGQEGADGRRTLALAVALLGVAPLLWRGGVGRAAWTRDGVGVALVAANALSYAGYLVLNKPLLARRPALVVIAWVYGASVAAVPFFVVRAGGVRTLLPALDAHPRAWASLAYVLLLPTTLAYFLNTYALARVRASTVGFFVLLQPLVTGVAGWTLLGERPGAHQALSAVLLPLATVLVAVRGRPGGEARPFRSAAPPRRGA